MLDEPLPTARPYAHGPCVARMICINVLEGRNELPDGMVVAQHHDGTWE
jgi:hypothetical protein